MLNKNTLKLCMSSIIICDLLKYTEEFLETAKVDKGHGIDHIKAVLLHTQEALKVMNEAIGPDKILAIQCAAILHDVDDHKFFPTSKRCDNARALLESIRPLVTQYLDSIGTSYQEVIKYEDWVILVISMIDLVSCSLNGNSNDKNVPEYMLYPRIADRLEAIGSIGIERAIVYGNYRGRNMYEIKDPMVTNLEELRAVASPERFKRYLAGEHSPTTIGHFYDKILHIGKSTEFGVHNSYFNKVAAARHSEVEQFVLDFWKEIRNKA